MAFSNGLKRDIQNGPSKRLLERSIVLKFIALEQEEVFGDGRS